MPISLVHNTIPVGTDSGNGKVSKNAWTEEHALTGTPNKFIYFTGTGTAAEPEGILVANNSFTVNGVIVTNTVAVGNTLVFSSTTNTSTTTANQIIGAFSITAYRTVKLNITVRDNAANSFQVCDMIILNDGGTVYWNEFAALQSNAVVGTFSANIASGNMNLLYSPVSSNTRVVVHGVLALN